jgi:hypothetical protein
MIVPNAVPRHRPIMESFVSLLTFCSKMRSTTKPHISSTRLLLLVLAEGAAPFHEFGDDLVPALKCGLQGSDVPFLDVQGPLL